MDNNKDLYVDPTTGSLFYGEKIEEIQKKINQRLFGRGHVSYHEMCEILAESITDPEVREEFLEGLNTPWTDKVGYIDLNDDPFVLKWKDLP